MSCAVCGRATIGLAYQKPSHDRFNKPPKRRACSMRCLDILFVKGGDVFQLHHFENQAIDAASDAAGEYLEKIGRSDLAQLSQEEWRALLQIIFVRSTATIQRLTEEGAVPF